MEASLAATGMFEVLATKAVRFIMDSVTPPSSTVNFRKAFTHVIIVMYDYHRDNPRFTGLALKADTHEGFCSRSMLQAHFKRVSTHEGAFSSSLILPRELAPKYLTC